MSTQSPTVPSNDPYAAAMSATARPKRYFGQIVQAEAWFCVLESGKGKVPFNPQEHTMDRRATAITIALIPLGEGRQPIEREMLDGDDSWLRYMLPSLRKHNLTLQGLSDKFVEIGIEQTGRKWKNKTDGREMFETALVVQQVFANRDVCQAANDAFWGSRHADESSNGRNVPQPISEADLPPITDEQRAALSARQADPTYQFALQSLPMLVQAAAGDRDRLATFLAGDSMCSKFFTIESPEVLDLLNPLPY